MTGNSNEGPLGFNSRDTQILIIEGQNDLTPYPLSPEVQKIFQREREKFEFWQKIREERAKNDPELLARLEDPVDVIIDGPDQTTDLEPDSGPTSRQT